MPKTPVIPETKSKEFWGDAEIIKCEPEVVNPSQVHKWRQEGSLAVCTSCPITHGIFIDHNRMEVRNGDIVDRTTGEVIYGRARTNSQKE